MVTREYLDALGEEIAGFSLRIDLATQAMLTYLREFDSHDGWAGSGFVSTATWPAWRIEMSSSAAREHVRVARALGGLQLIDEAFAAGKISYSKVRAITRVATPTQPNLDMRRFARRSQTRDGMVRIDIQLPPEQANIVWEAMRAAVDAGRSEDGSASEQLQHAPGGVGGFLRDGTPVPHHIARMLACDCSRVDVTTNESGEILDVGRARRTIPSAIGRALWLRDGGCRVPGCGRKYHLHAHHIEAWADGGKTSQSNLALLCPSHHALVHEGQLSIDVREGKLEFKNAYNLPIPTVPPRPGPESIGRWLSDPPQVAL
jgi:hypothetical protein